MTGKRYGRALIEVAASQGVAGVLKAALPVVVARLLGPAEFGVYSVVIVLILLVFNLGNLGISPSTTFHVARRHHADAVTSYNSMVLATTLGLVGMLLGGTAAILLRQQVAGGASLLTIAVAMLAVPSYYVVNTALGFYLGRQDYRRYNSLSIGFYVAVLVATLSILAVTRTALAAVTGWSVGSLGVAVVAVVMMRPEWRGRRRLDPTYCRAAAIYGVKNHAAQVLTFLNYRIDVVLIGMLIGASFAGLYAAAVAMAELVWFMSQVASWVLFARVAGDADAERQRRLTSITARLVFVSSAATAVLVGGLAVPILTTVYGSAFASAAGALRWLLVGVVSLSVSRVLANSIAAIGEPGKNVMGSLVALVSNVVLNVLLIPRFGIGGAAVASAVTYSMTLAHRLWVYRRVCGRSVRVLDYLVPRREDVALVRDSVLPRLRS